MPSSTQKLAKMQEAQKLYEECLADLKVLEKTRRQHATRLAKNMQTLSAYYESDWLADSEYITENIKPYPTELSVLGQDEIWNLLDDYGQEAKDWLKLATKIITAK